MFVEFAPFSCFLFVSDMNYVFYVVCVFLMLIFWSSHHHLCPALHSVFNSHNCDKCCSLSLSLCACVCVSVYPAVFNCLSVCLRLFDHYEIYSYLKSVARVYHDIIIKQCMYTNVCDLFSLKNVWHAKEIECTEYKSKQIKNTSKIPENTK